MTAGCTFTRHKIFAGVIYDPVYCIDMNIISSRLRSSYTSVFCHIGYFTTKWKIYTAETIIGNIPYLTRAYVHYLLALALVSTHYDD